MIETTENLENMTEELDTTLKPIDIITVAEKILDKADGLLDDLIVDTQSFKQLTAALKDLNEIISRKSDHSKQIEIVFHAGPEEWNE